MGRIGRTISAERERPESESERLLARKKAKNKKVISAAIFVAVFVTIALFIGFVVMNFLNSRKEKPTEVVADTYAPTVDIVDEATGATSYVTTKIYDYVGKLERDVRDQGYAIERVVVPANRMREVDVYLLGNPEYYKCNLDRGTAETAEDIMRMVKYLRERGITAGYVDVRIEGKAYYTTVAGGAEAEETGEEEEIIEE